jgi:hypothetical protein
LKTVVATLDACVLFQGRLTDLLLNLAEVGAFEPVWPNASRRRNRVLGRMLSLSSGRTHSTPSGTS